VTGTSQQEGPPELDHVPAGLLTVDASGTVVYANDTLRAMLGRDRDDMAGEHIDRLLPPASRIFFSTHFFPLLRVQGVAEEIYLPMAHADGVERPMLLNGRLRPGTELDRFDLVVVPMHQRNELEAELIVSRHAAQEAAASKDRFLSVVSHELRTPLTGISGYAELLLRGRRGPLTDQQRIYVERIRDAARYQATLIEDILDFAAIQGDRAIVPIAISVEELLARVEAILTVRADDEGRRVSRKPRPAPGVVVADARAVQQILLNLGTNALKYGRGPIRIAITRNDDRVRISVSDSGDGIAPDGLERIFEPFVRVPRADGDLGQGIGLGLAISRDLARAMGGDITVESTIGTGSTFTVELPADS
jgi:PAS domain S-box-containing protein